MNSKFGSYPASSQDNEHKRHKGIEPRSPERIGVSVFLSADCFGGFIPVSDEQVVRGAPIHGWSRENIDWFDRLVVHYNRTLGASFTRCFVAVEPSSAAVDIGIADGVIYVPLTPSFSPEVLKTYIDWALLHEPMHQRQRELLGISERTITAYLSSSDDVPKVLRGLRDWETKYSIPPLQTLCSILTPPILKLGVRLALDLHADARMFREGHRFIPPLSDEEVLHGLTPQTKLLAQCICQCVCEMIKVKHANDSGQSPQIIHLPYLARFRACIEATERLCAVLDATEHKALSWYLDREGIRLTRVSEISEAGAWVRSAVSEKISRKLATDYETVVMTFLGSEELGGLFKRLCRSYTDLLLLIINRREHLPHLSVLSEALANESDPLMRERTVDYLTEVGSYEALCVQINRLPREKEQKIQQALIMSISGFGSRYPKEVLKALSAFLKESSGDTTSEVEAQVVMAVGDVLRNALFSSTISRKEWQVLTKQAEAILMPLLAISIDSSAARTEVARAVVYALPILGSNIITPGLLQVAASRATWLQEEVIHAFAECFSYAYQSVTRFNKSGRRSSRWNFEEYDVGVTDEDLMSTFLFLKEQLETFSQSKQKKIREATLDAYEQMADTLSKCGLIIKEQCLEHLTVVASREKAPDLRRKAISLISALFHPWNVSDLNEGQQIIVKTPEGTIETPYRIHKATIHELECIWQAYDQILTSDKVGVEAMIAEEIGRRLGGRLRRHVPGSDGGMYAAIAWGYLQKLGDFSDSTIRAGYAEAVVRLSVIVPIENLDLVDDIHKYLRDSDIDVRNRTVLTTEQVLFEDRDCLPIPPTNRTRRIYRDVVLAALEDRNLSEDVRGALTKVQKRWESEIGVEGKPLDLPLPDPSSPDKTREEQLDELEKYLQMQFRAPIQEKRQMIEDVVGYILSEPQPRLRERAVELVFEPLTIHSLNIEEAFPPLEFNEDGSVTEPIVMHRETAAEVEEVLKGCTILMDRGDDVTKRATLVKLGETFGHSDFLTSAGGKGCIYMAFDFMKSFVDHPNMSVRLGLAEGAVNIYNVLVGISDGASSLILDLLQDRDPSVHRYTAAVLIKTIEEYGKGSSFARNLAVEVCAPVLHSNVYPQVVKDAFKNIDVESAHRERIKRFQHFQKDPDGFFKEIFKQRDSEDNEKLYEEIIYALEAPQEEVRLKSLRTVRSKRIVSAAQRVVKICEATSSDAERLEGVKTLGYLASDEGISYLISCLSDENRSIADHAARGLGRLRATRAIPELISIGLKSPYRLVVGTSVESLGKIYSRKNAKLFPTDLEKILGELASGGFTRLKQKCTKAMKRIQKKTGLEVTAGGYPCLIRRRTLTTLIFHFEFLAGAYE